MTMEPKASDLRLGVKGETDLQWDPPNALASVEELARRFKKNAQDAIDWYMAKRRRPAAWAQFIRIVAIISVTLGALLPAIQGTFNIDSNVVPLVAIGYLALAVGASFVALDRYAGASSSWARRIFAAQTLRRVIITFDVEWPQELAKVKSAKKTEYTTAELAPLFAKLSKFALDIEDIVTEETRMWQQEFQSAFAQLEAATKRGAEQKERREEEPKVEAAPPPASGKKPEPPPPSGPQPPPKATAEQPQTTGVDPTMPIAKFEENKPATEAPPPAPPSADPAPVEEPVVTAPNTQKDGE